MGLIKDSRRMCENCNGREATKALVIPGKIKYYVCDECGLSILKENGLKVKQIFQGQDGQVGVFRKE